MDLHSFTIICMKLWTFLQIVTMFHHLFPGSAESQAAPRAPRASRLLTDVVPQSHQNRVTWKKKW